MAYKPLSNPSLPQADGNNGILDIGSLDNDVIINIDAYAGSRPYDSINIYLDSIFLKTYLYEKTYPSQTHVSISKYTFPNGSYNVSYTITDSYKNVGVSAPTAITIKNSISSLQGPIFPDMDLGVVSSSSIKTYHGARVRAQYSSIAVGDTVVFYWNGIDKNGSSLNSIKYISVSIAVQKQDVSLGYLESIIPECFVDPLIDSGHGIAAYTITTAETNKYISPYTTIYINSADHIQNYDLSLNILSNFARSDGTAVNSVTASLAANGYPVPHCAINFSLPPAQNARFVKGQGTEIQAFTGSDGSVIVDMVDTGPETVLLNAVLNTRPLVRKSIEVSWQDYIISILDSMIYAYSNNYQYNYFVIKLCNNNVFVPNKLINFTLSENSSAYFEKNKLKKYSEKTNEFGIITIKMFDGTAENSTLIISLDEYKSVCIQEVVYWGDYNLKLSQIKNNSFSNGVDPNTVTIQSFNNKKITPFINIKAALTSNKDAVFLQNNSKILFCQTDESGQISLDVVSNDSETSELRVNIVNDRNNTEIYKAALNWYQYEIVNAGPPHKLIAGKDHYGPYAGVKFNDQYVGNLTLNFEVVGYGPYTVALGQGDPSRPEYVAAPYTDVRQAKIVTAKVSLQSDDTVSAIITAQWFPNDD